MEADAVGFLQRQLAAAVGPPALPPPPPLSTPPASTQELVHANNLSTCEGPQLGAVMHVLGHMHCMHVSCHMDALHHVSCIDVLQPVHCRQQLLAQ